jgi:hypothetical protein
LSDYDLAQILADFSFALIAAWVGYRFMRHPERFQKSRNLFSRRPYILPIWAIQMSGGIIGSTLAAIALTFGVVDLVRALNH